MKRFDVADDDIPYLLALSVSVGGFVLVAVSTAMSNPPSSWPRELYRVLFLYGLLGNLAVDNLDGVLDHSWHGFRATDWLFGALCLVLSIGGLTTVALGIDTFADRIAAVTGTGAVVLLVSYQLWQWWVASNDD